MQRQHVTSKPHSVHTVYTPGAQKELGEWETEAQTKSVKCNFVYIKMPIGLGISEDEGEDKAWRDCAP